jgi:hypothetical protein
MTRRVRVSTAALLFCLLAALDARSADVTSTWLGVTGEWTDGSLWSTDPVFPENGALTYAATIEAPTPGGFSVQLSRDLTVDSLYIRNMALSNLGTLRLATGLTLGSFGRISGGTVIASGASLFSGDGLQLPVFVNEGTTTWESGNLSVGTSGGIANAAAAFFTVSGTADRTLTRSLLNPFQNDGTFVHSSSGTTTIQSRFDNVGLVRIQAGSLLLTGGGTSAGAFEVATGATLGFGGSLLDTGLISGAGNLTLANSFLEGRFDLTGTTTVTGQMDLVSTGNRTRRLVLGSGPVSRLRVDGSVGVAEEFNWISGTLTGAGNLAVNGPIVIEGESSKTLDGFQLASLDGILWRGGSLSLVNASQFTNIASSTFEVDTSVESLTAGGSLGDSLIRNDGSLVKLGAGIANFQIPVESTGSIRVSEGELHMNGAFTSSGGITIAIGSTLQLGANSELLETSSVIGPGTLRLSGSGTQNLRGVITPGAIDVQERTTVHFLDPIALYDGAFSIGQGNASVSFDAGPVALGNVTALGGLLTLPGGSSLDGDFAWQFGTLASDGEVDLFGSARVTSARVAGAALRNRGSIDIAVNGLELDEGATLMNEAGGNLRFTGQLNFLQGPIASTFHNQGIVIDENDSSVGSSSTNVGPRFRNDGLVEVRGDGLDGPFKSTLNFTSFQQTSGTLWLHGGDVASLTGTPLFIDDGDLIGNGNLFLNVENRGRIAPGDVPGEAGRLVFGFELALFDDSHLDFEIGGTEPGIDFDVIDAWDIFLDGELSVRFIDGFEETISADDEFEIAVASHLLEGVLDGVGSGARLLTSDGVGSFAVFYGASSPFDPNRLVLTDFQAVPEPALAALLVVAAVAIVGLRSRRRTLTP